MIDRIKSGLHWLRVEVWSPKSLDCEQRHAWMYHGVRFAQITFQGVKRNNIMSQAGGLSYSSLLGLGPLIVLAVLVSSFVIDDEDEKFAATQINRLIAFVAPTVENRDGEGAVDAASEEEELSRNIDPKVLEFIDGIVEKARSGAVGVVGVLSIVVIIIQLFSTIETAFNFIWGVQKGRSLAKRIIYYWTCITLGAILGFSSAALLTGSVLASTMESLPWGHQVHALLLWGAPVLSFVLLVSLLMFFYKFIPNTFVAWWPAFVGALLVVVLLFLNQKVAVNYMGGMLERQTLYGSIAIIPIMMIGMYIFWLCVLLGGQVTYCVQNFRFLIEERIWDRVSLRQVEMVSLTILLRVARNFGQGQGALTDANLFRDLPVPNSLVNRSLGFLKSLGYLVVTEEAEKNSQNVRSYQLNRSLDSLSVAAFREGFLSHGDPDVAFEEKMFDLDPAVKEYYRLLREQESPEACQVSSLLQVG